MRRMRIIRMVVELLNGVKVHRFIIAQNKYQVVKIPAYKKQMFKIQNRAK